MTPYSDYYRPLPGVSLPSHSLCFRDYPGTVRLKPYQGKCSGTAPGYV